MTIIKTHTGKIYVDTRRKLEFLTVGDYGKENNIKADFLGLKRKFVAWKTLPLICKRNGSQLSAHKRAVR